MVWVLVLAVIDNGSWSAGGGHAIAALCEWDGVLRVRQGGVAFDCGTCGDAR